MRKKRNKVKVPEVLWRLFRHQARTLSATVTSFLPSSPPLIRRLDSSVYRNLLNRCFVVLSQNSPPTTAAFSPQSHWSQRELVARTIEMMISDQSASSNILCSGYDKYNQSSSLMEILTGPEWCLLLERVGEQFMTFFLKHTSIFLPISRTKYHQVAGPPCTELCFKMSKHVFESRLFGSDPHGPKRKREREDNVVLFSKRQQVTSSFDIDGASRSITSVSSCKVGESLRSSSCDHEDKHCQASVVASLIEANSGDNARNGFHQNSIQITENVRKRSRPFRWLRHQKRIQSNLRETTVHTCLERKVPRHVPKQAEVNKTFMFYNLEVSSSAFPRGHILNTVRPNSDGATFLLNNIFGISYVVPSSNSVPCTCVQHCGFSLPDSSSICLYQSLMKWLKILIRRAQNCHHPRLLSKHCNVETPGQNAVSKIENQTENRSGVCTRNQVKHLEGNGSEEIKSYCQKSQVVSFIWAVCRSIVPPALLGTPTNWRILTRNINKFVQLRRFEKFSLKQCMHQLKTSEFPSLLNKPFLCCSCDEARERFVWHGSEAGGFTKLSDASAIMKQRLLESWIYWLFSHIVVPLLQANFYVTDSECGRQEVFYYKKSVWENVKKRAIMDLKEKSYVYLDNETAKDIVKCRSFGFSKLRLLPKENGLRLLANLKAPSRMPNLDFSRENEPVGARRRVHLDKKTSDFHYFKPVNAVLRDAHAILKGIQLREPEKLGSSVFDYHDIYRKLCPFLIGLKSKSSEMPKLYLIASDVSKAFDSVDQNKLLSVMKDLLCLEKYTVERSSEVLCTKKALWVRDNYVLLDEKFNSAIPLRSTNSVLVNQECRKVVEKGELLFNLNEHVNRNLLQFDNKFYLQRVGICQGSVLSSLMCSLYYGDMDNKVIFPFLERSSQPRFTDVSSTNSVCQHISGAEITNSEVTPNTSYTLLRFIDDFLFISTSKQQAESFFSRLSRGFQDYNCFMNKEKYCVNFDISHVSKVPSNRLCFGEDGASFLRWSGLLINCRTLEIQADYTRYWNNHLSSSLTISWKNKPGPHLKQKLCGYLRPKCHPLFYDSNINSASVVRLNIFQSFLLCAMKFHCYFSDLSYMCKLGTKTYLGIIENSFRYMHFLIKKRMCSPSVGSRMSPILHLEDGEVEWLGLNAYIQVLNRKQSRHKKLLSLFKSKLLFHDLSWKKSSELAYAIDVSHSSLMWKIKY